MSDFVGRTIAGALSGGPRRRPTWAVVGVDPRGEHFAIERYFTRADAQDYADECNGNGGTVTVVPLRVQR